MARVTVSDLLARIEALEEEVATLKAAPTEQPVSFVVSVESKPAPLPGPLDFKQLATEQGFEYAYADPEWWGANRYL